MARTSEAQWRKLAVAVLDTVVDADSMTTADEIVEIVAREYPRPRVRAALASLIEYGAIRLHDSTDVTYVDANSLSRDGVRAMRDVWTARRDRVYSSNGAAPNAASKIKRG